jgi:hypothetical protein
MSAVALLGIATLLAAVTVVNPLTASPARALVGTDFHPDLIISDEVMYYSGAMNAAGIQAFLVAKGGTCAAGFTCLRDYHMTTTDKPADAFCNGYVGKAAESSAQIIFKASQSCGVNPQVLLVLLQKEQSLVTRTSPSSLAYRAATGYGCPDTAACSSTYYGFFNQVWLAAKSYKRTPTGRYAVGVPTTVLYAPNSKCGARAMTIKNKATARLYVYTPYTPNKAALTNLYGLGDSCSTYGNRNFWRLFNDWFGSSVIPAAALSYLHAAYTDIYGRDATDPELVQKSKHLLTTTLRSSLANNAFASTEYRTALVTSTYTTVLARPGDASKIASWVSKINHGSVSADSLAPTFLALDEFYAKAGGTRAAYVAAVYQNIFGRAPTDAEAAAGVSSVAHHGRYVFALARWRSAEHNTLRVDAAYQLYLVRPASPAAEALGVASITKIGYYGYLSTLLGSTEYLGLAQARFPAV